MNQYYVGDSVRVSTSTVFQDSGATPADPDVVTGKFKDPSGNVTTYVYGTDAELVKDGTGNYHFDIDIDEAGVWWYRIAGETSAGLLRGADEGAFEAVATEF